MRIFRDSDSPARPVDAHSFVGPATTKLLAEDGDDGWTAVHIYRVVFETGARTNWHTHSGPQWLLVIEGRIRLQSWGSDPTEATAGDAVLFAPGEKHWHGAPPDGRGIHLAVNINVKTEWLEPVSDEDYKREVG